MREKEYARTRDGLEVAQLLENQLLGDEVLVDEAAEGNHSQARVLDLSKLVLLELALVVALKFKIRVIKQEWCEQSPTGRTRTSSSVLQSFYST